jgi:hypothetical protein
MNFSSDDSDDSSDDSISLQPAPTNNRTGKSLLNDSTSLTNSNHTNNNNLNKSNISYTYDQRDDNTPR